MVKKSPYVLLAVALSLSFAAGAQDGRRLLRVSDTTPRIALVVGNGGYKEAALPRAAKDAGLVGTTLKELGFEVLTGNDLGKAALDEKIDAFTKRLAATKGVGFFYYAGHAAATDGQNYLIPVPASIGTETKLRAEAVDIEKAVAGMAAAGGTMNIVVIDAPQVYPLDATGAAGKKGLAPMDAPEGVVIGFAATPGTVAAGGATEGGLYARELVKNLQTPLLLEHVLQLTRHAVQAATAGKQTPWEDSALLRDFYFARGDEKEAQSKDYLKWPDSGWLDYDAGAAASAAAETDEGMEQEADENAGVGGQTAAAMAAALDRLYISPVKFVRLKAPTIDAAAMVFVPAGDFTMGSATGDADEKPAHRVGLDAYWIDQTPVTVGQFRKFCAATKRDMPAAPKWGWRYNHPMVNVGWEDARAYAKWAGKWLPTEAEWEYAARGSDGRTYPWGNEWSRDRLWCSQTTSGDAKGTAPVGSIPAGASPFGCLDMAGNVWNWCADWMDEKYYASAAPRNPKGPLNLRPQFTVAGVLPTMLSDRVVRGGSWFNKDSTYFRSTNRGSGKPDLRNLTYGFRCASSR